MNRLFIFYQNYLQFTEISTHPADHARSLLLRHHHSRRRLCRVCLDRCLKLPLRHRLANPCQYQVGEWRRCKQLRVQYPNQSRLKDYNRKYA